MTTEVLESDHDNPTDAIKALKELIKQYEQQTLKNGYILEQVRSFQIVPINEKRFKLVALLEVKEQETIEIINPPRTPIGPDY